MTANEAYKNLIRKWPEFSATSCVEYSGIFVFNVVPIGYEKDKRYSKRMNSTIFVDKKTGEVGVFQPFNITVEDYKSGKTIKNFK